MITSFEEAAMRLASANTLAELLDTWEHLQLAVYSSHDGALWKAVLWIKAERSAVFGGGR